MPHLRFATFSYAVVRLWALVKIVLYLSDKLKIIIFGNHLKFRVMICCFPNFRMLHFLVPPSKFIAEKLAFSFFNKINLFLVLRPPKIIIRIDRLIRLFFQPLHDKKIFPQLPNIVS